MSNIAIKAENLSKAYQLIRDRLHCSNKVVQKTASTDQKSVGQVRMRAAVLCAMMALALVDADSPFFASFLWTNKDQI